MSRALLSLVLLLVGPTLGQDVLVHDVSAAYQGAQGSDAFSAIHHVGDGRIVAGKRSSGPADRFLLSSDAGVTWSVVGCPGSTGAHTYFIGQDGPVLLAGTGDTGAACLMRSPDKGQTWSVVATHGQLNAALGTSNARAVFGVVALGGGHWLANVKTFDSPRKVLRSVDGGLTWFAPVAQPGLGAGSWARQMIRTEDGLLLWPSVLTERIWRSTDDGATWAYAIVPGADLFQPLCDAGRGVVLCGEATTSPNAPIRLFRSGDRGLTWAPVVSVNLQRPSTTYWRDVTRAGHVLYASACCVEGSSTERFMQLFRSEDTGKTWTSLGNPYIGPFGGMQAIYQMCVDDRGVVFAGCQPDSTILRWRAQ